MMKYSFLIYAAVVGMLAFFSCEDSEPAGPAEESEIINLGWEEYKIIPIDTFFYTDNKGLERILVELNGYEFKLTVDSAEVAQSKNAYRMPDTGGVTLNISALMFPPDSLIRLNKQGPKGSEALIIIGDLLLPGVQVDYVVTPDTLP